MGYICNGQCNILAIGRLNIPQWLGIIIELAITIYSFLKIGTSTVLPKPTSSITGGSEYYILSTSSTARCGQTYYSIPGISISCSSVHSQRFNKHRRKGTILDASGVLCQILCSYLVLALSSTQSDNLEYNTN